MGKGYTMRRKRVIQSEIYTVRRKGLHSEEKRGYA